MDNKRVLYFAEGECETKLVSALKEQPSLIRQGKVKKFNVIDEELKRSVLMTFPPGSIVILVFDTDVEITKILKRNLKLLSEFCKEVKVLTIPQGLNFENEIERSTDVKRAQDLTKSKSVSEFKTAVNRMKPVEFRNTLNRHSFDIKKMWIERPPKSFDFINQDADRIKL